MQLTFKIPLADTVSPTQPIILKNEMGLFKVLYSNKNGSTCKLLKLLTVDYPTPLRNIKYFCIARTPKSSMLRPNDLAIGVISNTDQLNQLLQVEDENAGLVLKKCPNNCTFMYKSQNKHLICPKCNYSTDYLFYNMSNKYGTITL